MNKLFITVLMFVLLCSFNVAPAKAQATYVVTLNPYYDYNDNNVQNLPTDADAWPVCFARYVGNFATGPWTHLGNVCSTFGATSLSYSYVDWTCYQFVVIGTPSQTVWPKELVFPQSWHGCSATNVTLNFALHES